MGVLQLEREGIFTVGQLRRYVSKHGAPSLLRFPNFGLKSYRAAKEMIELPPAAPVIAPAKRSVPPSICEIPILNDDSEIFLRVVHARTAYLIVSEIDENGKVIHSLDLDYREARGLAWALNALCDAHEE
jgi:hypothetical protein